MALLHNPETQFSKESVKWEAHHTAMGPPLRPYVRYEYPMMIHRAGPPPGGLGPIEIVETKEVLVDTWRNFEYGLGFRETPLEALDAYAARQFTRAESAAERNYDVKHKLSPKAAAEVAAAEEVATDHLAMVPITPIAAKPDSITRFDAKGDIVAVEMTPSQQVEFEQWKLSRQQDVASPKPAKRIRSPKQLAYDAKRREQTAARAAKE